MQEIDFTQVLMAPWAIPVIMGCSIAIVAVIGGVVKECIATVAETKLKRSMVERGFSPSEIERVLQASCDPNFSPKAPVKSRV